MLRFAVYDDDGPAKDFELINAYVIGPQEQVGKARIEFSDGVIECTKKGASAVGLCLMVNAGPMGRLMLRTCLLPDRDEPFHLTIELARHRIAMYVAKCEEWQMFELSDEHPATRQWEKARELFVRATTSTDPLEANKLARSALAHGIDATERLAMAHAEILLHRRFADRPASSATLGVRVHPSRDSQALRDVVQREFDVLSVPLIWREIEVEEGKYNWGPVDRWMDWARQQKKPIVAGPLIDFSKRSLPEWMYVWQHDYETCRDLTYDYIERVVQRYRGVVGFWNLATGLNINDNFEFTLQQMIDLVRMARLLVLQERKTARTMVEIAQPYGEHLAQPKRDSLSPLTFVERLVQEGVRLDAVGVQLLFGNNAPGQFSRDLMEASSLLDKFYFLEMPVLVSAMGVPSFPIAEQAGFWKEPWNPERQAQWVTRIFGMAMSKPYVESIFWTGLFDRDGALLPGAGLIDKDGRGKPALAKLVGIRKRLRKPLGPLKLPQKQMGTTMAGGPGEEG